MGNYTEKTCHLNQHPLLDAFCMYGLDLQPIFLCKQ